MNFTNIKLTQNQQLIINALLSMLASALVGAAQAGYQYVTQQGTINLPQVLTVFAGVLWVTFSTALVKYIPAHVQQELDAWRDTAMLAQSELARIEGKQTETAPATPHVVIYAQGASVQSDTPVQNSVNSVPAVAIPQRPAAPPAPKPVQPQTVVEPAQQVATQPQQVWLSTTLKGGSGMQQAPTTDDVLGDLPASDGQPMNVQQITGVMPRYGASGK